MCVCVCGYLTNQLQSPTKTCLMLSSPTSVITLSLGLVTIYNKLVHNFFYGIAWLLKIKVLPHVGEQTGHCGLDMKGCMNYIFLEKEVRTMY